MSEFLKRKLSSDPLEEPTPLVHFQSLQYALFVTCFVEVIGGIFFLATAIYIVRDKMKVDRAIAGNFRKKLIIIVNSSKI